LVGPKELVDNTIKAHAYLFYSIFRPAMVNLLNILEISLGVSGGVYIG